MHCQPCRIGKARCVRTILHYTTLSFPLFSKTFKLNVHFAPKTPVLKPNLAQKKLTCESNANPQPSYGWVMPDGSNVLTERTIDMMVRVTLFYLFYSSQTHFSPSTWAVQMPRIAVQLTMITGRLSSRSRCKKSKPTLTRMTQQSPASQYWPSSDWPSLFLSSLSVSWSTSISSILANRIKATRMGLITRMARRQSRITSSPICTLPTRCRTTITAKVTTVCSLPGTNLYGQTQPTRTTRQSCRLTLPSTMPPGVKATSCGIRRRAHKATTTAGNRTMSTITTRRTRVTT